jgi:phospholipase C
MQENRSFDHYFGTLNGVRGFADPRAVALPSATRSGIKQTAVAVTFYPFTPPRRTWDGSF